MACRNRWAAKRRPFCRNRAIPIASAREKPSTKAENATVATAVSSARILIAIDALTGTSPSIAPISMSPRCPPRPKLSRQPGGGTIEVA